MEDLRTLTSGRQVHSPVILTSLIHNPEESNAGAFSRPILMFEIMECLKIMASAIYDACRPPKHLIYRCACATFVHCWNFYFFATTLIHIRIHISNCISH